MPRKNPEDGPLVLAGQKELRRSLEGVMVKEVGVPALSLVPNKVQLSMLRSAVSGYAVTYSQKAMETLVELMSKSDNEEIRRKAALDILRYGLGNPVSASPSPAATGKAARKLAELSEEELEAAALADEED